MNDADRDSLEMRVLVLEPTVKDAELTHTTLSRAGIACIACPDPVQVCEQLTAGAGAIFIAEEAVQGDDDCLAEWLGRQPLWSDLPVLLLARAGANSAAVRWAMEHFGNVTVLEQPMPGAALVRTVRTALRARQRQYQLRDKLVEQERISGQLQMAMDAANAGSWQFNLTTGEFSASDRAIELHGILPGTQLNHERALECVHPDDRTSVEAALRLTVESGKPFRHEHRVLHPDGSVRWLLSHAERRDEGSQICVIGHVQDVTERNEVEQSLKESDQRFRATADAAPAMLWITDPTGRCTYLSRGWYDFTGQRESEGHGLGWTSAIHPDDREAAGEAFMAASDARRDYAIDFRLRRADGTYRWVIDAGRPYIDSTGAFRGFVGSVIDIDERKRAEAKLQRSEARFRAAIEAISDIIWTNDIHGMMVGEQVAWGNFTGQDEDSYRGYGWSRAIHPDDAQPTIDAWNKAVAGKKNFAFEHRVRRSDGQWRLCSIRAVPVVDDQGEIIEWVGVHTDITDRKRAEERLRLAADVAGLGVIEIDYAIDASTPDATAAALFGLGEGVAVPPSRLRERYHPNDRAEILRRTRECLDPTGEGRFAMEHRVVHPDGITKWLSVQKQIVFEEDRGVRRPVFGVLAAVDITARKEAEAALAQSEERSVFVRRSSGVGFWYCDLPFDVLRWDDLVKAHFHLPPDAVVTIQTFYDCLHADDREPTRQAIEHSIADRLPYKVDYRTVDPDTGAVTWVRAIGRTFYNDDGTPARFDGVTLDVSEQKRAEAELRDSEQRMRLATEATSVGIWQWNVTTGQIRWDAQMFRIYGLSPTDDGCVSYNTWRNAVPPEDLRRQEEVLQETVRTAGHSSREFHIRRASDGEVRIVQSMETARANADGHVEWLVGTNLDITDQKRAEKTLRESEARLGGILRRSPAGIVQTDAAGCMVLVNPRWSEMLGYSEAELLGRNILDITHPLFVDETAEAFSRLAAGGPDFQIEKAYRRKDGSVLRTQSNGAAIWSPDGKFLGLIAVVLDISERLRSEEELRRLTAELSEANRRKDEFLATLAHELRNPLAPISNSLQAMQLVGHDPSLFAEFRSLMQRQVEQMTHLINDLMDVSRINQGKIVLKKTKLSLAEVVQNAVDTSQPLIDAGGHQLSVTLPPKPVYVEGDLTRLSQVLANLLNNAAKYTDRGGRIRLIVPRQENEAILSVEDNGVGIPADKLEYVFDMFAQINHSLEKSQGGLGIGLNIVKRLVELHGGSISVQSSGHGEGSRFVVRLPIVLSLTNDEPVAKQGLTTLTVRRRILIVDDNRDSAVSMAMMLKIMGHETQTAHDGLEALDLAATFRPHLILLDIGMPKMNGFAACQAIRKQPWAKNIVIMALTGWGQDEDRRKSKEAGFDGHMVKPIDHSALIKLLAELQVTKP